MRQTMLMIIAIILITNGLTGLHAQTVTDFDGNLYNAVPIGTQVWLKENLKVTHYKNGEVIPNVPSNTTWLSLTTGACCNYQNNASYAPTYGILYNWFAVNDSRGICPTGWHVATDAEWTTLTDLLGGETVAGGKLKEAGTLHWPSPNTGATNEVDFTALGGGYRSNTASYIGFGGIGSWWCSTESSIANAWARGIFNDAVNVDRGGYYEKIMGFSVRCLMDQATGIIDQNFRDKNLFYPNPAEDRIFFNCCGNQKIDIKIFNVLNECVLQKSLNESSNEIDIHSLATGLYVIEINNTYETTQVKMIKK